MILNKAHLLLYQHFSSLISRVKTIQVLIIKPNTVQAAELAIAHNYKPSHDVVNIKKINFIKIFV